VILHLGMFIWMPDHSLKLLPVSSCVFRSATVDATIVATSAYHFLDRVRLLEVSMYPFFRDLSHRISGSTIKRKSNGGTS